MSFYVNDSILMIYAHPSIKILANEIGRACWHMLLNTRLEGFAPFGSCLIASLVSELLLIEQVQVKPHSWHCTFIPELLWWQRQALTIRLWHKCPTLQVSKQAVGQNMSHPVQRSQAAPSKATNQLISLRKARSHTPFNAVWAIQAELKLPKAESVTENQAEGANNVT